MTSTTASQTTCNRENETPTSETNENGGVSKSDPIEDDERTLDSRPREQLATGSFHLIPSQQTSLSTWAAAQTVAVVVLPPTLWMMPYWAADCAQW